MSKIYSQNAVPVLVSTTALATTASVAGSSLAHGYTTLIGQVYSSGSAAEGSGSGVHVTQSSDYGATWDLTSASWGIDEYAASGASFPIYGNAVKVQVWNGKDSASDFRVSWYLRPI